MTAPLLTYRGGRASADVVRVQLETLYETRMLLQGSSGAGKTQACYQLLQETHGHVQQIVLDREGVFPKLREKFDYLVIGGDGEQRIPMRKGALELQLTRVLELEISAIYDLSDLVPLQQQHVVARLASAMAHLPQRSGLWERMRLVLLDEAQWFAPQSGKAESLEALIELASLGRKRGFCPIAAGTRVAMINKSFTELLENKLIGRAGTSDSKRAAEELEFDKHGRKELRSLPVGHFYAYGPAIAIDPVLIRTPEELPVMPRRRGEHQAPTPATSAKVKRALEKFAGLEEEAEKKERTLEELQAELAGAKRQIQQLQKGAPVVDRDAIARETAAAVEKARATWTRDLRTIVDRQLRVVQRGADALAKSGEDLTSSITGVRGSIAQLGLDLAGPSSTPPAPAIAAPAPPSDNGKADRERALHASRVELARAIPGDQQATPKQMELLGTLRSFERIGVQAVPRPNLAAFVGYAASTKAFKNNLAEMRTGGWVEYTGDGVQLTDIGRAVAGDRGEQILTLEALHRAWKDRLAPADWKLLDPILQEHMHSGKGIPREELASQVGYATSTKAFKNGLSKLRTLGAIDYKGSEIIATSMMFPDALRAVRT